MRRYHITVGATTTADGTVRTGYPYSSINGQLQAREADEVYCAKCDSTGRIVCDGPRLSDYLEDRQAALDGDLCHCKCDPWPRLIAAQTLSCQEIETTKVTAPPRSAAPSIGSHGPPSRETTPPQPQSLISFPTRIGSRPATFACQVPGWV